MRRAGTAHWNLLRELTANAVRLGLRDPVAEPCRSTIVSLIVSAFNGRQAIVSSASAMPWPPPMHKVTIPRRNPSRRSEWIRRVVRTAPVAPIGWPWAMAPPSILTMSGESPSSRDGYDDRGEGLVDFNAPNVAELPACAIERLANGGDRP